MPSPKIAKASGKKLKSIPPAPIVIADGDASAAAKFAELKKQKSTVFSLPQIFERIAAKKHSGGGPSKRGTHAMKTAKSCGVHWYYERALGYRPIIKNFYLEFGTLVHLALAYHYAKKMDRKPKWFIDEPNEELSLQACAQGKPQWLRTLKDLMLAYTRYELGDPWYPVYNEEEFEVKVGALDPSGQDEPAFEIEYSGTCDGYQLDSTGLTHALDEAGQKISCTVRDDDGAHAQHKVRKLKRFPALNEELVTCRPDLIVKRNGGLWIIDHKTAAAARDGSGRLPIISDQYPDYRYEWQAMGNLHMVRQHMEIEGFIFNRMKREVPFDFSRDQFNSSARLYNKVPITIRESVRSERANWRKALTSPKDLVAHPWECQTGFMCPYVRPCHTDTLEERDIRLASEFMIENGLL